MNGWIELQSRLSGLVSGPVWAVSSKSEEFLLEELSGLGFRLYIIDGLRVTSEKDFFIEAKICFGFPEYFGMNWDAFNECLGDFIDEGPPLAAVIWRESSVSAARDLRTFAAATHLLLNASEAVAREPAAVVQLPVFFTGNGIGFASVSRPLES